jgi:hypothetical protein
MIYVASNVIETPGGLWRAVVYAGGGENKSAAVYWRASDAWKEAARVRRRVIAELQAVGYTVTV